MTWRSSTGCKSTNHSPPASCVCSSSQASAPAGLDSSCSRTRVSSVACIRRGRAGAARANRSGSSHRTAGRRSARPDVERPGCRSRTSNTGARSPASSSTWSSAASRTGTKGLYTWYGETRAGAGVGGGPLRPDGYGRYLLPDGELTFYLELDRGTESLKRVAAKLAAYQRALAADAELRYANVLLVCHSKRRLANLARHAPAGPPWTWATVDGERYELLPGRDQQRAFHELPLRPRDSARRIEDCLGRPWQQRRVDATREAA